jgi:hypothetical protein
MHGIKVLIVIAIVAVVAAAGVFTFVPDSRPGVVKKWFRQFSGFGPAKTPTEAVDKFREAIKKRDYETAAEFCDTEYKEQLLKVASKAKKLADAIDALSDNMDKHGVNNPNTKFTLYLLEPFPKTFSVLDIQEKGNNAVATVGEKDPAPKVDRPPPATFFAKHELMLGSLLPVSYGAINLNTGRPIIYDKIDLVKDETGAWKLKIPVTTRLRLSVDALKDNATNYANAIRKVNDEVKNDPVTKESVQTALERYLDESK